MKGCRAPLGVARRVASGVVVLFAVIGMIACGRGAMRLLPAGWRECWPLRLAAVRRIPASVRPGPLALSAFEPFVLDDTNSVRMAGQPQSAAERWLDLAGNAYCRGFVNGFDYARTGTGGPVVRLAVQPTGDTLRGRIEARGLKPNFAYQLKLQGRFSQRRSFEAIGAAGRWRLPGRETNASDRDYRRFKPKHLVEAYLLFDFLVTNAAGEAAGDFELRQSMHVLWNSGRQRDYARPADVVSVWIDASDPDLYVRPKAALAEERLWAEREFPRYRRGQEAVRLPPGFYAAEMVLTEESFHDSGNDGGWWATVMRAPVAFEIVTAPPSQ